MKDLWVYAKKCMKKLDAIGIQYGTIKEWNLNTRAKRRWGQCRKLPEGGYSINISAILLQDDVSDAVLENTIIHELLHSCKGCMNHGVLWKQKAALVNTMYPQYHIKRTISAEEMGIAVEPSISIKHKFVCKNCGNVITRQRESKFTRNYTMYRCGKCGGRLKKEF